MTPEIAAYLRHMRLRNLSPATVYQRHTTLTRLARFLEPVALAAATEGHLKEWQRTLQLAARSHYTTISNVACFYDFLVEEGWVKVNPAARLPRPKLPRRLPRPISEADLLRAVDAAEQPIRAMLVLAGWCGLRCAEIAAVCTEDLLLSNDPPLLLVHGKGRKDRLLGLGPGVLAELRAVGLPRSGPVFRRQDGRVGANEPHRISQMLNRFLHEHGIEATAHQCRHRLATVALRESHDLTCVAQILGHDSISSTQIYAAFDSQEAFRVTVAVQESLLVAGG